MPGREPGPAGPRLGPRPSHDTDDSRVPDAASSARGSARAPGLSGARLAPVREVGLRDLAIGGIVTTWTQIRARTGTIGSRQFLPMQQAKEKI